MEIKQLKNNSITIRRFDTGENITFGENTIIDVDQETADYLLNFNLIDGFGEKIVAFTEV